MHFQKLQFEDITRVKEKLYFYAPNQANDYTATGLFLWRDYLNVYAAYEPEGIYIYQYVDGRYLFYFPLCEDIENGFRKIIEYCKNNNLPYGFYPFTAENTAYLDKMNVHYEVNRSDNFNDYLYYVEDLAEFKGKNFHRHKNHVNKFDKEYSSFSFEFINESNIDEVKTFFTEYAKEKQHEQLDSTEQEELRKIPELLDNLEEYNLFGYCIKIDNSVKGFELGEIVGNMYYSHIQKADREIDGIYTKMVNSAAKDLKGRALIINREEDMGDPGLRDSKQRYHPFGFVKKEMIFCEF